MSSRSESSMAAKKVLRQCTGVEADRVGQPPFLWCELDDVLLTLRVDDKTTQTTVRDESRVACHLSASGENRGHEGLTTGTRRIDRTWLKDQHLSSSAKEPGDVDAPAHSRCHSGV